MEKSASPKNRREKTEHDGARIDGASAAQQLLVAMIIDKSGSMSDLIEDTVGGFNEYLADLQRETPDALISVTLFDTTRDEMHVAMPVTGIPKLTATRYRHGGMGRTALNDAVGGTIAAIDAAGTAQGRKVLVVVMTDGHENASKEWTSRAQLAALVKQKEVEGWKFVFFGADIDAFTEGAKMNIPQERSLRYEKSRAGTSKTYRAVSRATNLYARNADEETWVSELSKPGE